MTTNRIGKARDLSVLGVTPRAQALESIPVAAHAVRVSVATQVRNLPRGPHFTNRVLREMSLISIVAGSTIAKKKVIFRLNQSRPRALGNSVIQ